MNEEIKNNICAYLEEGMFKKDAASMAGISEATFYRWIEEDKSFESRVEASILEYKHTLVKNLTVSTQKDGRLALEVLRRRFPAEWGENASLNNTDEIRSSTREVAEMLQKILNEPSIPTALPSNEINEGEESIVET